MDKLPQYAQAAQARNDERPIGTHGCMLLRQRPLDGLDSGESAPEPVNNIVQKLVVKPV